MLPLRLGPRGGDRPHVLLGVDLGPLGPAHLAGPRGGQHEKLERQLDHGSRARSTQKGDAARDQKKGLVRNETGSRVPGVTGEDHHQRQEHCGDRDDQRTAWVEEFRGRVLTIPDLHYSTTAVGRETTQRTRGRESCPGQQQRGARDPSTTEAGPKPPGPSDRRSLPHGSLDRLLLLDVRLLRVLGPCLAAYVIPSPESRAARCDVTPTSRANLHRVDLAAFDSRSGIVWFDADFPSASMRYDQVRVRTRGRGGGLPS